MVLRREGLRWCTAGAVLAGLASGCATFSEPVSVSIMNDLRRSVTFSVCDNKPCSKRLDPWTLPPGKSGSANVEVDGGYNSVVVLDSATGAVLGCLPLRLSRRPDTALAVAVSRAVPCGSDGGATAARGHDWPDPSL